jgi:gas vesicle protein
MNSGKLYLGALAGIAIGALIGILFAPEKGTVIRKKISRRGSDYVDEAKEKFDDVLDNIAEKFDTVKDRFIKGTSRVKAESVN